MRRPLVLIAIFLGLIGCFPKDRDDGFKAKRPISALPADSAVVKRDTAVEETSPDAAEYGFSLEMKGAAELHFHDDEGRHTGPATAEEYLPVLEAALRNPNLHEQERQGLERMRDQIKRTGSAADLAITRRIPNMDYNTKGGTVRVLYRGAETLDMRLVAKDYAEIVLEIKLWDRARIRTANYVFSAAAGQEAGMDVGAQMEDLTLSLSGGAQGEEEREIQPQSIQSAKRK